MNQAPHAPSPYCDQCGKVHHRKDQRFYVSLRNGSKRYALLLGPYETHEEAVANVERGKRMARESDMWADFYAFGTASSYDERSTVFGK
ncbi:MAG: hypothetical protein QOH93_648 [Chloroflexia bacterium]|jgi:hypothetical protein|nr:hypothetical protein [Chloroflexia bacterium]